MSQPVMLPGWFESGMERAAWYKRANGGESAFAYQTLMMHMGTYSVLFAVEVLTTRVFGDLGPHRAMVILHAQWSFFEERDFAFRWR